MQLSSKAAHKLDVHRVCASMKVHPASVESLEKHLEANGWLVTDEEMNRCDARQTKLAIDDAEDRVKEDELPLQDRPALQLELHRNFKYWCKVPPAHLTTLLGVVQPMAFAAPMLKALRVRGQREAPGAKLLEYLERECGVDPGSEVGDRRWLYEIAEDLLKRSETMGNPCKNMKLPAKWSGTDGVYSLYFDAGLTWLLREDRAVPIDSQDINRASFSDLRIETNQSAQRATLRSKNDSSLSVPCVLLYMKGLSLKRGLPKAKLLQKAIGAGPGVSSTGGSPETPADETSKKGTSARKKLSPMFARTLSGDLGAASDDEGGDTEAGCVKEVIDESAGLASGGEQMQSDDEEEFDQGSGPAAAAGSSAPRSASPTSGATCWTVDVKPELSCTPPLPKKLRTT